MPFQISQILARALSHCREENRWVDIATRFLLFHHCIHQCNPTLVVYIYFCPILVVVDVSPFGKQRISVTLTWPFKLA